MSTRGRATGEKSNARRTSSPRAALPHCSYCLGHGLYADYWKAGMRRVMEKGTNGKPAHPNERRIPCDRCGKM